MLLACFYSYFTLFGLLLLDLSLKFAHFVFLMACFFFHFGLISLFCLHCLFMSPFGLVLSLTLAPVVSLPFACSVSQIRLFFLSFKLHLSLTLNSFVSHLSFFVPPF